MSSQIAMGGQRPHIGVLVEERYLAQDQPQGLVQALGEAGAQVTLLVADHLPVELGQYKWAHDLDLVVPRGRSAALLALLRTLEAHGVPVLHSAAAIAAVVDKAGMAAAIARAGIPSPRTWLGELAALAALAEVEFPVVVKPLYGDNARGIKVARSRTAMKALVWDEPVALAQPFFRGDGHDVKIYVAGDQIWAVRRPSPIGSDGRRRSDQPAGEPVEVTEEMRALVAGCAAAFGLSLFGLDCVVADDELLLIEVNEFPNYRGLPDGVAAALAEVVLAEAGRLVEVSR